ncbi:hypothetical protein [Perigonia lusca single nucleopolyhedrovirus]|uniref:Uncharacterized protein n=1 Tax=Perigonia lusca single nucleopolyhedrovirus TaxID=1675865 RepID=A0A0M3WND5_9ABAC|nr:hypothetical protein [Perigonia lusca single nucleopolyhedrovirus]AKN80596.1 hypothetical protein [Perigonia lusca single nucleopolyhedrovirus]
MNDSDDDSDFNSSDEDNNENNDDLNMFYNYLRNENNGAFSFIEHKIVEKCFKICKLFNEDYPVKSDDYKNSLSSFFFMRSQKMLKTVMGDGDYISATYLSKQFEVNVLEVSIYIDVTLSDFAIFQKRHPFNFTQTDNINKYNTLFYTLFRKAAIMAGNPNKMKLYGIEYGVDIVKNQTENTERVLMSAHQYVATDSFWYHVFKLLCAEPGNYVSLACTKNTEEIPNTFKLVVEIVMFNKRVLNLPDEIDDIVNKIGY